MADQIVRFIFLPFFATIDSIIYRLIEWVYNLMIDIATLNIFTDSMYEQFNTRIYTLIGLFMLFKLSFSLIKFIINPDEFSDKSKGGKKIIVNVLIVLLLIITTPMIFNGARTLQIKLLENHVVENLILGMGGDVSDEEVDDVGQQTAFLIFSAFYKPSPASCDNIFLQFKQDDGDNTNDESNACLSDFGSDNYSAYKTAYKNNSVPELLDASVYGELLHQRKLENGEFAIDYYFLLSTLCGGVVAWVFFLFCFDFAVRTVKLAFLQLIAPIPVISYIDPDSSKNGMFNRWVKESIKTYLDLFIRLAAVYFAIYIIMAIRSNANFEGLGRFGSAIVVIGVLVFARQIPKLVKDLFGFKSDTKFSLSLGERIRQAPGAGWAITKVQAGLAGGVTAAVTDQSSLDIKQKIRSITMGAMAGMGSTKLGFMGKEGTADMRVTKAARQAGYKSATGTEMRPFNPGEFLFRPGAEKEISRLKKYRDPLYSMQDELKMKQSQAQDMYNALAQQRLNATDDNTRQDIDRKMQIITDQNARYSQALVKVGKAISAFDDQIKDNEKQFNVDKSPVHDMNENMELLSGLQVEFKDGKYTSNSGNLKDTDYYNKIMNSVNNNSEFNAIMDEPIVGMVANSAPAPTATSGPTTTDSGIILNATSADVQRAIQDSRNNNNNNGRNG